MLFRSHTNTQTHKHTHTNTHTHDQTVQRYTSVPIYKCGLHQIPPGHEQSLQPQGTRNPLGRWRVYYVYVFCHATISSPNASRRSTPCLGRGRIELPGETSDIYRDGVSAEQDFSTSQRDLQNTPGGPYYLDKKELSSVHVILRHQRPLESITTSSQRFSP